MISQRAHWPQCCARFAWARRRRCRDDSGRLEIHSKRQRQRPLHSLRLRRRRSSDCGLACVGAGGEDDTSSISNGLLPAALAIGASTTQKGYDIAVTFGFYPGISTNDGSPNLGQGATSRNTALGTTGLDIRQVFLTFGNDDMGEFLLGRNIGLFGADAILNDMTLPGVAGNGNYATPSNTSLGSIGLGYIYTDWLAQINYTTPDFNGLEFTIGIFDPLEPVGTPTAQAVPESAPGFHGKVAYESGPLYLSATFISQKHEGVTDASDFDSFGFDIGGKIKFGDFEFMAWYYQGEGIGTTALFLLDDDLAGNERDSDGFLAQITYKLGDTKIGLNYGESISISRAEKHFPILSNRIRSTHSVPIIL